MGIRKDDKLQLLLWVGGIRSDTIFLFVWLAGNEYFSTECLEIWHSWACSDPLIIIALSMEQFYVKWSNLMFQKLVVDFAGNNGAKWQGFMHNFRACSLGCIYLWHSDTGFEHLLLYWSGLIWFFFSVSPLQDSCRRALIRAVQEDFSGPSCFRNRTE